VKSTEGNQFLQTPCTVFEGARSVASGTLERVVPTARTRVQRGGAVLIFDDATGTVIDVDYRGTARDALERLAARATRPEPDPASTPESAAASQAAGEADQPRARGRPRLGVVAREVTLLPRHWAWLASQPGGASVALRRLVEEARRANLGKDRKRRAQEIAYRVMTTLAGNLAGYEEAIRALFAGDGARFEVCIRDWPVDVRTYAGRLAAGAFDR
jgi:hypothetical protein